MLLVKQCYNEVIYNRPFKHDVVVFPIEPHGNVTVCKLTNFTVNIIIMHVRYRICDVTNKHSCLPRMSALENITNVSIYLLVVLESK